MKNLVSFVFMLNGKAESASPILLDAAGVKVGAVVKVIGFARGDENSGIYAWVGKVEDTGAITPVKLYCRNGYDTPSILKPKGPGDVVDVTVTVTNPGEPPIVGGGVVVINP